MGAGPDIRFITRKWPPAMGGMETYSVRLTEELSRHRAVDVIALPGKPTGEGPSPIRLLLFGLRTSVRLLFSPAADVVHIGDVASWPLGWIASLRHPRSRIVLAAHGSDISYALRNTLRGRLYGWYIRLGAALLRKSLLIGNSSWIVENASQFGFMRSTVVPLGTDASGIAAPQAHNGCLFFAGRIAKRKGLSDFVTQVLPLLSHPPVIRVAGAIWDPEEAAILASEQVRYLGVLGRDDLQREYCHAMCVIVPSLEPEGFGLVAVEAASAGGVVLASNHSGLKEAVVEDGGFLLDARNPSEWARAIENVAGWSPVERTSFVHNATARARKKFCWESVADETIRAYEQLKLTHVSARSPAQNN